MRANFEELDKKTRKYMLEEFEKEQKSETPYISKRLSELGKRKFIELMKEAIENGDDEQLVRALSEPSYWNEDEGYTTKQGMISRRNINYLQAAEQLGFSEFNTWYVRGLAKKLMDEGIKKCQIYRAKQPKWEPADCSVHEGQIVDVKIIYNGHRAKYWPIKNNSVFSIPAQPGCHHSIRRIKI